MSATTEHPALQLSPQPVPAQSGLLWRKVIVLITLLALQLHMLWVGRLPTEGALRAVRDGLPTEGHSGQRGQTPH